MGLHLSRQRLLLLVHRVSASCLRPRKHSAKTTFKRLSLTLSGTRSSCLGNLLNLRHPLRLPRTIRFRLTPTAR